MDPLDRPAQSTDQRPQEAMHAPDAPGPAASPLEGQQAFTNQGAIPAVASAADQGAPQKVSASEQAYGDADTGHRGAHAPAHAPDKKVARLRLFTDVEASHLGLKELRAHQVGHTWIALEYIDPQTVPETMHPAHKANLEHPGQYADSMGFWPDTVAPGEQYVRDGHHPFAGNPLNSFVPGLVHQPDHAHQGREKATETWELTQSEVDAVIHYAEAKRHSHYSVYFYNCTTFAAEAVAAAGKAPPHMPIMMPNALYSAIKSQQREGVGDTMTKDLDGKNERDVHGRDEPRRE
jgi:hypothetical protein